MDSTSYCFEQFCYLRINISRTSVDFSIRRVPNEPQEPANLRVTVNESGAPCPRKAGVPGMGVWGLGPKEVKMSEKKIKNSRDTRKSPSTLQPEVSPPFKARVR